MTAMATARVPRQVQLREYHNAWEYWRDLQRHVSGGWAVESTLERSPSRDWVHYATLGLATRLRGPERLVTYVRRHGAGDSPPVATAPVPARLPRLALPSPVPAMSSVARAATKAIGMPVAGVDVVTGG